MTNQPDLLRKLAAITLLSAFLGTSTLYAQRNKENERLENAGTVMVEATRMPETLPKDLLNRAVCVIVIPSTLRAAFVVGVTYGRGVMTCRTGSSFRGPWGAPSMIAMEGGNFGVQVGGQSTDYVLLLMNPRAPRSIMSSKFKIGADAAGAAITTGRHTAAATDLFMRSEILSYSRSRGVFVGVSLEGSTLRPDRLGNVRVYGKDLSPQQIVLEGKVEPPSSATKLLDLLNTKFPQNKATTAENRP